MNTLIQLLDINYELYECRIKDSDVVMEIGSKSNRFFYPYCGHLSDKIHSRYQREVQDLPIQGKRGILLIVTRNILNKSLDVSSVSASKLLASEGISISKSSICAMLKKMPEAVDKSHVLNICVDDFAIRKRFSCGTIMVDLDTHRIIDLLPSRETQAVQEWLKTYPTIRICSCEIKK